MTDNRFPCGTSLLWGALLKAVDDALARAQDVAFLKAIGIRIDEDLFQTPSAPDDRRDLGTIAPD